MSSGLSFPRLMPVRGGFEASLGRNEDMALNLPTFQLRFDMRAPGFGAPRDALYAAAIEMVEYADQHGFFAISLAEHHGVDDGYCPSSITLAAAMAARSSRVGLRLSAIVVPLHDPLRLAEEIAVLDIIAKGRVTLVAVGGYLPNEFEMFSKPYAQRGRAVEDTIKTLRQAWTGEPFSFRGRTVCITPKPINPCVPIFMGGSSAAAARRAGRLADGFITHLPDLYQIYFDEAQLCGKNPDRFRPPGPAAVFVTEDKDRAWRDIGPHALHEMTSYGRWQAANNVLGAYSSVMSMDELKASGSYAVVTPEECVALARKTGNLLLHPLLGGLPPEIGWKSLQLFAEKVIPELKRA